MTRTTRLIPALAALAAVLAVAHTAHAAPPDDEGLRGQIRARVRAKHVEMVTRLLALDEPTTGKYAAVIARFDDQIAPLRRDTVRGGRELKGKLDAGTLDDATINRMVDHLIDNQARIKSLDEARAREVRKVLTPAQFARLVIALPRIKMHIQRELLQAVRGNGDFDGLDE